MIRIIVMIGSPYSGKGTQCEILSERTGLKHISTGAEMRKEKEINSDFGREISSYQEQGELVPDELIEKLLIKIIQNNKEEKGIILDGFPRTKAQVDFFIGYLKEQDLQIEKMFILIVSEKEIYLRSEKRFKDSSRKDDNILAQAKRLELYSNETIPAINYLKTKVAFLEIDGENSIEIVADKIVEYFI